MGMASISFEYRTIEISEKSSGLFKNFFENRNIKSESIVELDGRTVYLHFRSKEERSEFLQLKIRIPYMEEGIGVRFHPESDQNKLA